MIARLAPRWSLWLDTPRDGATNMAVDLALLDHARRTGDATLRVYAWGAPTLSFGRNERARDRYDRARLEASGVATVRRPTGGRALLHHREVTYSVTARLGEVSPSDAYRAINALLAAALERIGVAVEVAAPATRMLRPDGAACFAQPSAGELVVGGAKLVGSAQVIEGGALLQHGSILLDDDQQLIAALRAGARGRVAAAERRADDPEATAPVATLRGALGRDVSHGEVADALAATWSAAVTSVRVDESAPGISASVAAHRARLSDPAWTWRR